ncbi:Arginase/deacetylase [Lentithecium fluviatile CBS 122367]|uniref:Arginase/deacetylase n=1 Tax=Lentithecium fluviatile CBS 122367 TaxID=1168545 RepID=A0A6G1IUW6_9PLEO|nr:Arginase/deacetylase [Lentithecium fluviatile CBS 122367]
MTIRAINVVNIPSDIGSIYAGKSRAPTAFQSAGLQKKLGAAGYQVREFSALSAASAGWTVSTREPNGARNESRTVEACKHVLDTMTATLTTREQPTFNLILGGECLYCPAIMSAYWRYLDGTSKRVGIMYVDADCDFMKAFSRLDGSGVVDSSNIVLFGFNTNSEANKRDHMGYLFDNNFRVVTSQSMEAQVDYIVVHLDVDVIDPGEFPLCNTMTAVKIFLKSNKTIALSVAEVNPDHDPGLEMTERLVDQIVEGLST